MKLFKRLAVIFICIFSLSPLMISPLVFADDDPICNNGNISDDIKAAHGCPSKTAPELGKTVANILYAIIAILGLVAVIFVLIGGIQYMTSTGDPAKTKKARDTILYALIGLVICVLSFAIVNFTINNIINQNGETTESTNAKDNK